MNIRSLVGKDDNIIAVYIFATVPLRKGLLKATEEEGIWNDVFSSESLSSWGAISGIRQWGYQTSFCNHIFLCYTTVEIK